MLSLLSKQRNKNALNVFWRAWGTPANKTKSYRQALKMFLLVYPAKSKQLINLLVLWFCFSSQRAYLQNAPSQFYQTCGAQRVSFELEGRTKDVSPKDDSWPPWGPGRVGRLWMSCPDLCYSLIWLPYVNGVQIVRKDGKLPISLPRAVPEPGQKCLLEISPTHIWFQWRSMWQW